MSPLKELSFAIICLWIYIETTHQRLPTYYIPHRLYILYQGLAGNLICHPLSPTKKYYTTIHNTHSPPSFSLASNLWREDQASPPTSQPKLPISTTDPGRFSTTSKRRRNLWHNSPPSNHISDHKNILVSFPTTVTKLSSNQLLIPNQFPHLIMSTSFYHEEFMRPSSLVLPSSYHICPLTP